MLVLQTGYFVTADAFARLHSASNPDALPIAAAAPPTASVPISVLRNDSKQ